MNDKVKQYLLKIIYNMDEDELIHLSEEFSDLDTYKFTFKIDGKEIPAPKEMLKYLKMSDQNIGIA